MEIKMCHKKIYTPETGRMSSVFPHDRRQDFPYTVAFPICLPPVSSLELQANNLHFTLNVPAQRSLYLNCFLPSEDIKAAVMRKKKLGLNRQINKHVDK